MEDIVSLVANQGFSIVISIFLLMRMENKIEQLNDTINELSKAIVKLEITNNKFF